MVDLVEIIRTRLANGRTIADSDVRKMADETERLRAALTEIAEEPCMDPEGNAQIARAALSTREQGHDNDQIGVDPDEGLPTAEDVRGIFSSYNQEPKR